MHSNAYKSVIITGIYRGTYWLAVSSNFSPTTSFTTKWSCFAEDAVALIKCNAFCCVGDGGPLSLVPRLFFREGLFAKGLSVVPFLCGGLIARGFAVVVAICLFDSWRLNVLWRMRLSSTLFFLQHFFFEAHTNTAFRIWFKKMWIQTKKSLICLIQKGFI